MLIAGKIISTLSTLPPLRELSGNKYNPSLVSLVRPVMKLKQFNIVNWTGKATLLGAPCNIHIQIGFMVQPITAEPCFYTYRNGRAQLSCPKFVLYPQGNNILYTEPCASHFFKKEKSPISDCSTNIFYFFSLKLEDKSWLISYRKAPLLGKSSFSVFKTRPFIKNYFISSYTKMG